MKAGSNASVTRSTTQASAAEGVSDALRVEPHHRSVGGGMGVGRSQALGVEGQDGDIAHPGRQRVGQDLGGGLLHEDGMVPGAAQRGGELERTDDNRVWNE